MRTGPLDPTRLPETVAAGLRWIIVVDLSGGLRELFMAGAAGSIVSAASVAGALWLRGWGSAGQASK